MIQKLIFVVALVLCTTTIVHSAEEDDDFDGVTVEDEVDPPTIDIPYESPTPLDRSSVYLAEHFDDSSRFDKKWVKSQAKKEDLSEEIAKYDGIWKVEAPLKDSLIGDMGLVLKSKAKHAAISSKLDKPFIFSSKPLIVQYEVILQDGQECGGAYLKLLSEGPETKDLKLFRDKTPYTIMFGPDKCGNDHKLHFIFQHKNPINGSLEEKHCKKPKDRLEDAFKDKLPHLYTLILRPDNSFEIWLDRKIINAGSLLEDFTPPVNPPVEIDDPNDKKPVDWDEREKIPDPDAVKPDDWDETAPPTITDKNIVKPDGWLDNEEPMIPDPSAKQPEDWDIEMDGEWEPPLIDNPKCAIATGCGKWEIPTIPNPAYKGKWRPPMIDNPNYKGKWTPRRVPNPDFFEDLNPFKMHTISAVGFEIWSMSQDILFDNLIITDDLTVANKWAADSFELKRRKIAKDSESFLTRMLSYADENPMLWVVYVIGVGLPLVLMVYCCCNLGSTREEREEVNEKPEYDAAEIKKTDGFTKDDEPLLEEEKDKNEGSNNELEEEEDDDKENIEEKIEEKDKEIEKEEKEESDEQEEIPVPDHQGDAPRKRKVRKE